MITLNHLVCLTILLNVFAYTRGETVIYELEDSKHEGEKVQVVHVVPFKAKPLTDSQNASTSPVVTIQPYKKPDYVSVNRTRKRTRGSIRKDMIPEGYRKLGKKVRKSMTTKILLDASTVRPVFDTKTSSSGMNIPAKNLSTTQQLSNQFSSSTQSGIALEATSTKIHKINDQEVSKSTNSNKNDQFEGLTSHPEVLDQKTDTHMLSNPMNPVDRADSVVHNLENVLMEDDMQNMFNGKSSKPKRMSIEVTPGDYPIFYVRGRYNGKFGKYPIKAFGTTKDFMKYILSTKSATMPKVTY